MAKSVLSRMRKIGKSKKASKALAARRIKAAKSKAAGGSGG